MKGKYWIKTDLIGKSAASLEGVLRIRSFDSNIRN